jgi:hypothetical protein
MKFSATLLASIFVMKAAFACSPVENTALKSLEGFAQASVVKEGAVSPVDFKSVSPACKSWPQKDGYAIVVKPYVYSMANRSDESYLGMVVAVLSRESGAVLAKINEKKIMAVDAIIPTDIGIDTANYLVRPDGLAFGIRTKSQNYSDAAPFYQQSMSMYTMDHGSLEKVVNSLMVNSYNGEGNPDCEFSGIENAGILSVLRSQTMGYYDLRVSVKTTYIKRIKSGASCKKIDAPAVTKTYDLKFNGNSYRIPKALQAYVE